MAGLWNFLFSFSFDKNLSTYSIDELNGKLKELDLEKHLDCLEKAFEVQKTIIDKLKTENEAMKKEIRELKVKYNDTKDDVTPKVSYPELQTILCYVKWSGLENNALESRVIDLVRHRLVTSGIELEVQPWSGERTCVQPTIIFCPFTGSQLSEEVEHMLRGVQSKSYGATALIITHDLPTTPDSIAAVPTTINPPSANLLAGLALRANVRLVVDIVHQSRRFSQSPGNEQAIDSIIELVRATSSC